MMKRVMVTMVCLIMAASMSTVFAGPDMLMTKDQMMDLTPSEMTVMYKSQMSMGMYIGTMDKMMTAMTPEQIKLMTEAMMTDPMSQEKMTAVGTKEQWTAMDKEKTITAIDNMMKTMTADQLSSMTDKTMVMMTKEQMVTMMMNNNSSMNTNTSMNKKQKGRVAITE